MSNDKPNPMSTAQRLARPELPKRFYKVAEVAPAEGGWALHLDGRAVKTPARKPLVVASRVIAEALAAEWAAQGEHIDPATMPLTKIVNAALDRVTENTKAVRDEIVRYAGTDLICYRAEDPESLVAAQEAAWEPLVAWARDALGARLVLASGVIHTPQDAEALAAVERALASRDALTLAALSTVTTLTGSAVIALALMHGVLQEDAAWKAAHVDEDWQMGRWGRDEEALAARALRWREMAAAALVLKAVRG